jgi:sugar lactone lactonase YvrE
MDGYCGGFVWEVSASTGLANIIAGNGSTGYSGDGGPATSAELYLPGDAAVDGAGNVYIADTYNQRIRKITASTGIITTVAGVGTAGFNESVLGGTEATNAELNYPTGVAVDSAGNIYIADSGNSLIRKVTASTGVISTVAGDVTFQRCGHAGFNICPVLHPGYSGDGGSAVGAELNGPTAVRLDGSGNIYIADAGNDRIREVAASSGIINTVAGNGTIGFSGDGGAATSAEIDINSTGVATLALDAAGNLYIGDVGNYRVRVVGH